MTGTDYSTLTLPPVLTRSTNICHCYLCKKGRDTLVPGGIAKSAPRDPPVRICPECQGEIAPGVSHVCTRSERNNNILEIFRSVSGRSKGQILSQTLKGSLPIFNYNISSQGSYHFAFLILDMKEVSGADQVILQTKGTPLPVTLGTIQEKPQRILSQENSRMLQNERYFTDNDMRLVYKKLSQGF